MKLPGLGVLLAGRADFPDSRIGASLKQFVVRDALEVPLHFPDSRIGASLKQRRDAVDIIERLSLPRFANRGLIEALVKRRSCK